MKRRSLLTCCGLALAIPLAGCMFLSNPAEDPEDVHVRNQTEQPLQGKILIEKFDDDSDEADGNDDGPERPSDPADERVLEFDVDADDSDIIEDGFADDGEYYVEVTCEREETESTEIGFYAAGPDGESIGGGQMMVTLNADDSRPPISIGQVVSD